MRKILAVVIAIAITGIGILCVVGVSQGQGGGPWWPTSGFSSVDVWSTGLSLQTFYFPQQHISNMYAWVYYMWQQGHSVTGYEHSESLW